MIEESEITSQLRAYGDALEEAHGHPPTSTPSIGAIGEEEAKRRRSEVSLLAAATVAVFLVLVGGVWAALDRRVSTVETVTGVGQPTPTGEVELGEFVWPAPPRGFESADQLAESFIAEVLNWTDATATLSPKSPADANGPIWLQLARPTASVVVDALAVRTEHGWGFVQIGNDAMTIRQANPETGRLWFTPLSDTSTDASIRYATTSIEFTTDQDFVELPDSPAWYEVTSVLLRYRDSEGRVVGVAGRQFAAQPGDQELAVTTTVPPNVVTPRDLATIEDVEQLIDDYGNCVMANAQGGSLAIQVDRTKGIVGQTETSHQTSDLLDAIDAKAELCDAALAFSASIASRTGPPTIDSEWIVFGDPILAAENADRIVEVHLDGSATLDQTDTIGAWLAERPDVEQVIFLAPSVYRITLRNPAGTRELTEAVAALDGIARVWTISPVA